MLISPREELSSSVCEKEEDLNEKMCEEEAVVQSRYSFSVLSIGVRS